MSNSNQIQAIQTALKKLSEIKNEAAFEIPPTLNDPQIIETLLEIYPEADTETQQIIIFVIRNFDVMGANNLLAILKATIDKLKVLSPELYNGFSTLNVSYDDEDLKQLISEWGKKRAADGSRIRINSNPSIEFYTAVTLLRSVSKILEQLGSLAVPTLINALSDELNVIRQTAADVLGSIGDPQAIEPLINALQTENENAICGAIIDALVNYAVERVVKPIVNAVALSKTGNSYKTALALKKLGKPAVEPMLNLLQNQSMFVRKEAAFIFIHLNDERAVLPLINALNEKEFFVRKQVVTTLGYYRDERIIEPLIELLKEADYSVRDEVLSTLENIAKGDERLLQPLITALFDQIWNEYPYKRASLLATLGEKALDPLLKALNHENENIRQAGAHGLAELQDKRALEPLIEALEDTSHIVRQTASYALGEIGDLKAFEPLLAMFKDKNEIVRSETVTAFGKLGNSMAVEPLIQLLNDESSEVLVSVADELGRLQDKRAVEPLIKLLKTTGLDSDSYGITVNSRAAEALGEIGDKRAVEPLVEALEDEEDQVRYGAAEALGKLGEEWTIPYLETLEFDKGFMPYSGEKVSEAAAKAIRQIKGLPEVDG